MEHTARAELSSAFLRMRAKAEKINERALVISWKHLTQIKTVAVVAGGIAKKNALWTLLLTNSIRPELGLNVISELTTDVQTAQLLLTAKRQLDSNADLYKWYEAEIMGFLNLSKVVPSVKSAHRGT